MDGQFSEIHNFKPFRECDSIQQVFNIYDSMEGRALLAEAQVKALEADRSRIFEALRDEVCKHANHGEFEHPGKGMILQLTQPLPLDTPRGRAWAHFVQDYGSEHPLLFICFSCDSGECWIYRQDQIRLEKNITLGIRADTAMPA